MYCAILPGAWALSPPKELERQGTAGSSIRARQVAPPGGECVKALKQDWGPGIRPKCQDSAAASRARAHLYSVTLGLNAGLRRMLPDPSELDSRRDSKRFWLELPRPGCFPFKRP